MSKDGQITIQFNWIFLLIVGGIILFFFIGLVSVQKKSSEGSVSAELLSQLSTYFTGAGVSIGTVTVYDVPRMHLEFTCDKFYVNEVADRDFRNKVLFTPHEIHGNKLITWTLDWSVPFRVMNLIYISSPQIRYVVFYGTSGNSLDLFKDFNKSFPPELNYHAYPVISSDNINDYAKILDYNNEKIHFVDLNSPINQDLVFQIAKEKFNMAEEDIVFTKVVPSNPGNPPQSMQATAKVEFYDMNKTGWSKQTFVNSSGTLFEDADAFDSVSLYGAVVSGDLEKYSCVLSKMFANLNRASKILKMRSQNISNGYLDQCRGVHFGAAELLSMLSNADIGTSLNGPIGELDELNRQARRYSCAPIY
jgi:hypothetical protein